MSWLAGVVANNPAANDILLDTGPVLREGDQPLPTIVVTTTAPAQVAIQLRDSANATTLKTLALVVDANQTLVIPSLGSVNCVNDQRLRAVLVAAIVGRIQVSFLT